MTKTDFLEQVSIEIGGRIGKGGRLTDQQKDDWFYFCQNFTVDTAIRNIKEFFRGYEGRFAPKANEFGLWLRQQGRQPVSTDNSGSFFSVEALKYPRVSLVHFSYTEDGKVIEHFGWIERTDAGDYGMWWKRDRGGLFVARALTPDMAARRHVTVKIQKELTADQRKDWIGGPATRVEAPLGLASLLERIEW